MKQIKNQYANIYQQYQTLATSMNNHIDIQAQAIDSSLNKLRQLQSQLKSGQFYRHQQIKESIPSGHIYTHTRIRTEPYEYSHRNNSSFGPYPTVINEKTQSPPRSPHARTHTYTYSQPTMVECNQNQYGSVKDIIKENRKLKKYVNCLLQMNDYLKNQLVKKDTVVGVNKMGHSFQLELMRMEIQYLKELNKDKQLELRKNIQFRKVTNNKSKSVSKSKIKDSLRTIDVPYNRQHYNHCRSSSAYDSNQNKSNYQLPKYNQYEQDQIKQTDRNCSQKYIKGIHPKINTNNVKTKKKKPSNSFLIVSNKKQIELEKAKGSFKKRKNTVNLNTSTKKCRLCYI